ncbi:MAG TPA: xanthine dehydrogenase family protein molybdopterin-binding subunit [Streptosporangiaceae bacterium]|nr:xanthine dehydrogenase family protein molybdopterin-binding subunit [Streptosporangiaceae bacterium]
MPGSLLGNSVRRVEDPDLLTGKGTYVGNLKIEGLACAAFVRSPLAHARLVAIDTEEASRAPGVLGVFTAADLGIRPFHSFFVLNEACARPPLAEGKVRFVGDAVAVVIAETETAAVDAAELVNVDYEPLQAVVDPEQALADGAPLQFEELGTNLVASSAGPPQPDPLAGAATVVRACLENQRIAVVPLEGDAVAAVPGDDGDGHDLTVYVSTQMPHTFASKVATNLDLDLDNVRVVTPHVGGAFGGKAGMSAEHAVIIAAARKLGRPVRWVQTRSDNLMSMPHGRGQVQWIEMGFDTGGHLTGMHCRILGDAGAYAGFGGALATGPTRMMAQGVYQIPAIRYDAAVAVTNTTPMGAFRGAGRPEAAEFLERMMDIAACQLGIDPVELRRRNLRPAFTSPVETVMGATYDTGDYTKALDEALRLAGYEDLRAQQAARRASGDRLQLGIGVSVYVEITAGAGGQELGIVEVHRDGSATIRVGTSAHGQGHATAFSMIVSETLGIPIEQIRFVQSDTAAVPRGGGTGGSRSLQLGGSAVLRAAEQVLRQARSLAATELEAATEDIVVHDDGRLGVAGVPSSGLTWAELATLAEDGNRRPNGQAAGAAPSPLAAELDFKQEGATFPFGAHVSVVEVDTETGKVRPLRHIAVDDCGRILNPLLVTGQQHGGIAQGMAQALWEQMIFDEEGNPVTASLADYAMPSAAELPSFDTANTQTPTFNNPLGAKGIGESGTIGSMPAVHNAVVDAVSHLGVRHIAMPCTPQRVWQAIRAAAEGGPGAAAGGRPLWRDPPPFFDRLPVSGDRGNSPDEDVPEI